MDGLILLGLLLAQGISGPASTSLQVDASLAFDSYVTGEAFSELRVRAISDTTGSLLIESTGVTPKVRIEFDLLAGEAKEVRVPIQIGFNGQPFALVARLDQAPPQNVRLDYLQTPRPRYALAGRLAADLLEAVPGTESISASALPHIPEAYAQISALAMDSPTVASLDSDQLRSLLEYVGTCGRLLLIDVSAALADVFANRAACEGRFLNARVSPETARRAFTGLLDQTEFTLPSERQLERLLSKSSTDSFKLKWIILFVVGYVIVMLLLLVQSRSRFAALSFSIVTTVLVVAIWPGVTSRSFVAWAEMASNEHIAHYAGLERHRAARHGTFTLAGDGFGGHTDRLSGTDFSLHFDKDATERHIVWNAAPFEQMDLLTQGSFAVDTTLQFEFGGESVSVCNIGSDVTTPMYLQWEGNLYELSALEAQTRWSTIDHIPLETGATLSAELRVFLERSIGHPLTLLESLPVPTAANTGRAWLLRYQSDSQRGSSCET